MIKEFCEINVTAHPHELDETYRNIFTAAVRQRASFRGKEFALLSPITPSRNGVFSGVIALWTEIDQDAGVLQLEKIEEIEFDESGVQIPPDLGFNPRLFQFSFNETSHRMFVELKNEKGQTVTPATISKALIAIFKITLDTTDDVQEINVSVVPRVDAIERILELQRIQYIYIKIVRPNPDRQGGAFERVNRRMEEQKLGAIEKKAHKNDRRRYYQS